MSPTLIVDIVGQDLNMELNPKMTCCHCVEKLFLEIVIDRLRKCKSNIRYCYNE
jgi:hypothetical protein